MGDLSKIKVAIGQIQVVEGRPSALEAATDAMVDRALDAGADALVVPGSLEGDGNVRLIGLNDSRIDVAGDVIVVEAGTDVYRVGNGADVPGCDFCIYADTEPFVVEPVPPQAHAGAIVIRPVGMRDVGHKVLAFGGGSAAFDANGQVVTRLNDDFEEDFAVVSFGGGRVAQPCADKLLTALVSTIRRFDEQVMPFGPRWVIGLSGGLDSSIVAALLVLALGRDRVIGYNMATRFNSASTKTNAAALAETLGIAYRSGSIEDLVVAMGNALVQYGYPVDALGGLVLENVQARTRGNLLATFAALEGGVVANNGNRIEAAMGYATLYGDSIGALAPIGDLTKVQLFDLAIQINRAFGCDVIPANLLPVLTGDGYEWQTMPSAELANGQRDPMKWFYHDWLVPQLLGDGSDRPMSLDQAACGIMERYLDDGLESAGMGTWVRFYGLDDPRAFVADLDWVLGNMNASAFKRIQAAPRIALASCASLRAGAESQLRREPSNRFNVLRSRLLSI